MLTLFHGDNLIASRKALNEFKLQNKNKEIIVLDGNKADEIKLHEAFESVSLFGENRLVVLENFLTGKNKKDYFKIFVQNEGKEIIFWEAKEVGKIVLNKLPKNTKVFLFKYPVLVFKFLENLLPRTQKNSLDLYLKLIEKEDPSLIFFLLARHIRSLIIVKDESNKKSLPFSPWQYNKLTNQAKYFTMDKLQNMLKDLLKIDISVKTGNTSFNLNYLLEQFLIFNL